MDLFPCDQVLNNMTAAVKELTRKNLVQWIVFTGLGRADIDINRREAAIGRHIVQPDL